MTPRICPTSYVPDCEAMKPLHGSTNEIADRIRGFEAMGVEHLPVWLLPNNNEGIEAFAPVLEELRSGIEPPGSEAKRRESHRKRSKAILLLSAHNCQYALPRVPSCT